MEILPQEELKQPKGLKILFYFGLAFLFFSIVGFFILNHFLEEAQKERSTLEVTIKERLTPEKLKIKEEVFSYQRKINDFSFLINQQTEISKFFNAFEKIVHPYVWFSMFDIILRNGEGVVTLSGRAQNFEVLGQQLLIIQNNILQQEQQDRWIKSTILEKIAIAEDGKIDFDLSLSLDSKIFK